MSLQLAKKCYTTSPSEITSEHMSPAIYSIVEQLVFNQNSDIARDAQEILDYIGQEDQF